MRFEDFFDATAYRTNTCMTYDAHIANSSVFVEDDTNVSDFYISDLYLSDKTVEITVLSDNDKQLNEIVYHCLTTNLIIKEYLKTDTLIELINDYIDFCIAKNKTNYLFSDYAKTILAFNRN